MNRRGQSLVETTLVLTAFLVVLLGVVDIGQMLIARQALAERVRNAVRWGAMNAYDAEAIRNLVLYGRAAPIPGDAPFGGMQNSDVVVGNPGCPGPDCRVTVAVGDRGVAMSGVVELP